MGTVVPLPSAARGGPQTGFSRTELNRIVDLYGRMVAAGLWKDYAIELRPDAAAFWAFRRAAERPEYRIEKRPGARHGPWALIGEAGQALRRGQEHGPGRGPPDGRR